MQQRRPLVVVERRADHGHVGQQQVVLHVEDARRHVGALEAGAEQVEAEASPRIIVLDGEAVKARHAVAHLGVEAGGALGRSGALELPVELQPELVHRLPHLLRDAVAHHAGVLARQPQAGADGVGVRPLLRS